MTMQETAQAEAKELIEKYSFFYPLISKEKKLEDVKRCALIAVEAQIEAVEDFAYSNNTWDKRYKDEGYRVGDYNDASTYYYAFKQAIIDFE